MRRIQLEGTNVALFDKDVTEADLEFFLKHKKTFKCMWADQGQKFWIRFVITFRWYSVNHGVLSELPGQKDHYNAIVDRAFIYIHENFIDAKYSQAKTLLFDTMVLSLNKGQLRFLDTKPMSKDPFYAKETRDVYRRLFGDPLQRTSYVNVYLLIELYVKFGGAVLHCLRLWMNGPPLDPRDESYWTPPQRTKGIPAASASKSSKKKKAKQLEASLDSNTKKPTMTATPAEVSVMGEDSDPGNAESSVDEDYKVYLEERLKGSPFGPQWIRGWYYGDPRFVDEANPLYNLGGDRRSDWRSTLDFLQFKAFQEYVQKYFPSNKEPSRTLLQYHPDLMCYPPPPNRRIYDEVERLFLKRSEVQFKRGCHVPMEPIIVEDSAITETFSPFHVDENGKLKLLERDPLLYPGPFADWRLASNAQIVVVRRNGDNPSMVESKGSSYELTVFLTHKESTSGKEGPAGEWAEGRVSAGFSDKGIVAEGFPSERSMEKVASIDKKESEDDSPRLSNSKFFPKYDPNARRVCRYCGTTEPQPRLYKKCQRCKVEKVASPCYYCSRNCQVVDWNERHRSEHQDDVL